MVGEEDEYDLQLGFAGGKVRVCYGGLRVADVELEYPQSPDPRGTVVCFARVKVEDGCGNGFQLKDIRLAWHGSNYSIHYPDEVKRRPCQKCRQKNEFAANFCCKCGERQPDPRRNEYTDRWRCLNGDTAAILLDAILAEHDKRSADHSPIKATSGG